MADSDGTLDRFLVEVNFQSDPSGANKADALVKQTEAKITATTAAEAAKRVGIEEDAGAKVAKVAERWAAERTEAEAKAAEVRAEMAKRIILMMSGLEVDAAGKVTAKRKVEAGKATEVDKDHAKKSREIRAAQFKEVEAGLLRFSVLSQGLAAGLVGALSSAPFGAFLLGVERTASGLSKLAVQSQRVGSSAAGIQRFLFAMKRQGVDEGEATGALEGFASKMKMNPEGYRQALERMQVKTTGPDGKPLGYDEMLENFGGHLATIPYSQAKIQAEQFGVSGDNALNALRDPAETRKGLSAYDDKLKAFGLDPNKVAADARKVQQSYDNLEADLKIIRSKLDAEFFVPMMNGFDNLAKKMEENPKTVENFGRALEAFSAMAAARVLPVLANLAVKMAGLAPILGGSVGTAIGIAANPIVALGASAESTPGKGVSADPVERAKEAAENQRLTDEANAKSGQGKGFWNDLWTYAKKTLGLEGDVPSGDNRVRDAILSTDKGIKELVEVAKHPGGASGDGGMLGGSGHHFGGDVSPGAALGDRAQGGRGSGPSALKNAQQKANAAAIADELRHAGAPDEGTAAVLGSMQTESGFNPRAHNDVSGGHTGLWQWDSRRWPKIRAWIEAQKGDPWDARWQTKAYIAEGHAKSGDPLYDGEGTSGGFRDVMDSKGNLPKAVHGVQRSERFGVGEEGGRAANAGKWLGHLPGTPALTAQAPVPAGTSAKAVTDAEVFAARQRIVNGSRDPKDHAIVDHYLKQQNTPATAPAPPIGDVGRMDRADRRPIQPALSPLQKSTGSHNALTDLYGAGFAKQPIKVEVTKPVPGLHKALSEHIKAGTLNSVLHPHINHPFGVSPALHAAIDNSRRHSSIERHGDTFHVHAANVKDGMEQVTKVSARRESQDRLRYMQGNQQ